MAKIKISADDLGKFGGMRILSDELNISNPANFEVELSGKFTVDCMEALISFLKEKKSVFKSLTFSPNIKYVPGVYGYSPAKTLVVPEGVYEIKDFSICNCTVEKLYLSSTVQKISSKAFFNTQFKKIEISKNNSFYSMEQNNLINNLTEEIIVSEIRENCNEIINKINSPENIKLWDNMKSAYKFTVDGPAFWKKNYEEKKAGLEKVEFSKQFTNPLEALKHCLSKNIDALENLVYLPCDIIDSRSFFNDVYDLFNIIKSLTGENRVIHGDSFNKSLLLYTSKLLHPGTEPFFFLLEENGIEVFAPQINLYLFFPEEEAGFIPSYLDYLKNNFITLTKAYIMNHENQNALSDKENISNEDRKSLTKKLELNENRDKLVEQCIRRIKGLANSYNLDVRITADKASIFISSAEEINGFSFLETVSIDSLLTNGESDFLRLDEAFRQLHIAISCVMDESNAPEASV